jgi:hypothetical protein
VAVSAAHSKKVYAKATSSSPIAGDEIAGVTDASSNVSVNQVEISSYKDDAYKRRLPTLIDCSISISGNEDMSDSPQGLLRSNLLSGGTLYITILDDGTNGYSYPVTVSSYERAGGVADANTFSCTCELNGTPIVRP